jgi:uncharacterized OB-fold protein
MGQKLIIGRGLFTDDGGALLGQKCRACNRILPPLTEMCCQCFSSDLEGIPLSKRGRLFSYTVVHVPVKNFQPPYAIGWIELPEGLVITSQIKGWEKKHLEIGMDMEFIVEKLWEENGEEIIGYKFQPA